MHQLIKNGLKLLNIIVLINYARGCIRDFYEKLVPLNGKRTTRKNRRIVNYATDESKNRVTFRSYGLMKIIIGIYYLFIAIIVGYAIHRWDIKSASGHPRECARFTRSATEKFN